MAYTEVKTRNGRRYYYRVISMRKGNTVAKSRKYLGVNLQRKDLLKKEVIANGEFIKLKISRSIKKIRSKIIGILKKNKIKKAGIFGSYAEGKQKKNSDIDIIVEPPKGMGFGFAGLEIQLSRALRKKVDLVSYNGLSPYLKEKILKEEVKII